MAKPLIVLDTNEPLFQNNRVFNLSYALCLPGCGRISTAKLFEEAQKKGFDMVTGDLYVKKREHDNAALCMTDMFSNYTDQIMTKGARPTICSSLESPVVARKFYHNIEKYAGWFKHNFQYPGTMERLQKTNTIFHPTYFPMEIREPLLTVPWKHRSYLIMICANKRAAYTSIKNAFKSPRALAGQIRFLLWQLSDPWMRIPEIYIDRIKAIYHFSNNSDFKLYGANWDQPIVGFSTKYQIAAKKVWEGTIDGPYYRKREIMSHFKFSICFENCSFPGYITEKIFDCFLAGCIPVYYGAPDITYFVPQETFIDFRNFQNFKDLEIFLSELTETEAKDYINSAKDFLISKEFDKFTLEHYVDKLINVFVQEFQSIN
jgi:hypothetical protein